MKDLRTISWSIEELGQALAALARASGLDEHPAELADPPAQLTVAGEEPLNAWLEAAAAWLGLEVEAVEAPYAEVSVLLARNAPSLVRLRGEVENRYLAIVAADSSSVKVIAPDHRRHRCPVEALRSHLCADLEAPLLDEIEALLDTARIPRRRRRRARSALLAQRLGQRRVRAVWLLRLPAGASVSRQVRQAGLPALALRVLAAHVVQESLFILSWWALGYGVLHGRLDPGWLAGWALLLLSMAPFRGLEHWSLGRLTATAGALLKRRLLAGALRLEPDEVRHRGVGQFLGQVIDSEAVESLVLSGGHVGLVALTELLLVLPILALGVSGWLLVPLLLGWLAFAAWLWRGYLAACGLWTGKRLEITHDLVEKMVGQRTRLVQLERDSWHDEEDQALESYLGVSLQLDRRAGLFRALIPRGWILLGMLGAAPAFVAGNAPQARLAVTVGGVLLAYRALWKLEQGLANLAQAAISWRNVKPLFDAAARSELRLSPSSALALAVPEHSPGATVIDARELSFRYASRAEPALSGCDLEVHSGERVLVEGPSGSGKSTLASLLAGVRAPTTGLLLLDGLDRQSLGERGWRQRVAAAPQFHENHVITETLAFNLLMGRRWPAPPTDIEEAEALCRELGLGPLLDRMPAGLLQMVGESGWQLSHGERSRLFIARALLQDTEVVILDESFAALDPESLTQALGCVERRVSTLLVVAHP